MFGKNSQSKYSVIDLVLAFFMVVFLISLDFSIFVNQIGYFGSLIILLIKWGIEKKNPFTKNGLEIPFLIFIIVEFLAASFSIEPAHAFQNLSKRVLLLPVAYVVFTSIDSLKTAITYFLIFVVAASFHNLIYLYFSYEYYIYNLYNTTGSGPGLWHHQLTTSGLIIFTSIFLFAFAVYYKTNLKYRILFILGFLISAMALISTFKRTGWLSLAFGIFIILLLKKQYKLITLGIFGVATLFFISKNEARIDVFDLLSNKSYSIQTDGRPNNLLVEDSLLLVSNFDKGLSIYKDNRVLQNNMFKEPIANLYKANDSIYIAYLLDMQFLVLNRNDNEFKIVNKLSSPGFTNKAALFDNKLYVIDADSGLTIYNNLYKSEDTTRYSIVGEDVFVDSNYIIILAKDFSIHYKNRNQSEFQHRYKNMNYSAFLYNNEKILFSNDSVIDVYDINSGEKEKTVKLPDINRFLVNSESSIFALDKNNNLFSINIIDGNSKKIMNPGYSPASLLVENNKVYSSFVKRNRLLSVFDPYLPSNFVRLSLWRAGWRMFLDRPLLGVGDIDLSKLYKQYKDTNYKELQGHLHNNFMHILATLGILGLFSFCFIFYKLFSINKKIFLQSEASSFGKIFSLGYFGVISAFLFAGLTELNFFDHEVVTLLWFSTGLNFAIHKFTSISKK